jgi:hypothetical protein
MRPPRSVNLNMAVVMRFQNVIEFVSASMMKLRQWTFLMCRSHRQCFGYSSVRRRLTVSMAIDDRVMVSLLSGKWVHMRPGVWYKSQIYVRRYLLRICACSFIVTAVGILGCFLGCFDMSFCSCILISYAVYNRRVDFLNRWAHRPLQRVDAVVGQIKDVSP